MFNRRSTVVIILMGALAIGNQASSWPQSPQGQVKEAAGTAGKSAAPFRNQPVRIANREAALFASAWGIADPTVKAVESGLIIRFTYTVLDPLKAKALSDKKVSPYLESEEKQLQLVVPTMEKVGQLRQAPHDLLSGESYWMVFSNPGRQIKPGDRVDIAIGGFHARGLTVQ